MNEKQKENRLYIISNNRRSKENRLLIFVLTIFIVILIFGIACQAFQLSQWKQFTNYQFEMVKDYIDNQQPSCPQYCQQPEQVIPEPTPGVIIVPVPRDGEL